MAYRHGKRNQISLFPESLDSSVDQDDPVRAYDAFIDALDLKELGISLNDKKVGNSEYDPIAMLKLLVYAYSYGWRSSRKIERAVYHNLSFIWLIGGLKPDHKTISEFRRRNKRAIKKMLKQCVRICMHLDLIEGNTLFVDGTKIRANASRKNSWTKAKYDEFLLETDKRIEEILNECENIDQSEKDNDSLVKMKKEFSDKKQLKSKIENILKEFKDEGTKSKDGNERKKNLTDPNCKNMQSFQGIHASYNIQSVVDDKNSLIVSIDPVSDSTDHHQLTQQIANAEEITEKECEIACADSGYSNTDNLEKLDKRGTKVIVPSQRQALHHKKEKLFSKREFKYDEKEDCYYCPEGKRIVYKRIHTGGKKIIYEIESSGICKQCRYYGICTKSKRGRRIIRLKKENLKEKLEKQYEEKESQQVYRKRKMKVEHPFGHIKNNLGLTQFLLRGLEGVKAEITTAATCFNIVRMITLSGGVQNFTAKMQKIAT